MLMYSFYFIFILAIFLIEKSIQVFIVNYVYENDLVLFLKTESIETFQKKRYKKASRIILLLLLFPLLNFNMYYFMIVLVATYFEYKRPYIRLKARFKADLSLVRYQFPIWLRQIQILLYTNNVLNSLQLSMSSAPVIIISDLKHLIETLMKNPNDLHAFTDFMSDYEITEIDRAMKLLYRTYMIEQDDTSKQLNRMIASTTKWIRFERLKRHEDSLKFYEWIGIIPLFGVTIVFLVIMASLLTNLFGKGGM